MEQYDNNIFIRALQIIKEKPDSTGQNTVMIPGYKYDPLVFNHLMFLYKEGYIKAWFNYDESDEVAQIFPTTITQKGEQFLNELLIKK